MHHQIWVKYSKVGPQASHLGQMVRGDHRHQYCSNAKGGPQASNIVQMVRGDHMHQIWVKW